MSDVSRSRRLQQVTGLTFQQAKNHLKALSLDVRGERDYLDYIKSKTSLVLKHCGCGRAYFDGRTSYGPCPFCEGKDAMVTWFFENYEDPANGVPHDSSEGGYQYIFGGPYDADEELQEQFPHAAEAMRGAAVEEIQGKGWEWVKIGQY